MIVVVHDTGVIQEILSLLCVCKFCMHCKFRMALNLLITDDPNHEKYYQLENWEVIPVDERASHTCYKEEALGSNFWPKLLANGPRLITNLECEKICQADGFLC